MTTNYDPRAQYWHSISFQASADTEAELDAIIELKMRRTLNDPEDWVVVNKQMHIDGDGVLHADVTAMRVAGLVPWPVIPQERSDHDHS